MATEYVMDASAILAVLNGERGRDRAMKAMSSGRICAINLAEVVSNMAEEGVRETEIESWAQRLPVVVVDFDRDLAMQAGFLRKTTSHKGLSLGDRACLALAMRENLPVMTGDRAWTDLDLPVEVVLIR
ncbi:MAG TPA: type II toxin-antitoxin system VapC family toxin [Caulobacter sp.]|nr:type II toxin-antitoxin system VapC family toxin [Caulobacter sp.]